MLSRGQVATMVRDKETYYNGMLRNGWLLPAPKQSLVTLEFMERVRLGQVFCPRVGQVRAPPPCVTPPPKRILLDKIIKAGAFREGRGEDISTLEALVTMLVDGKQADSGFLLQVLHLVNENDEIFRRDYVYEKPKAFKPVATLPLVCNADGFFDGLPLLKDKKKGRGEQQLRLTRAQKDAMQLQVLEQRHAQLEAKINSLRGAGVDGDEDRPDDEEEKSPGGRRAGPGE